MVTQSQALKLTEQAVAVACSKFGDKSQVKCVMVLSVTCGFSLGSESGLGPGPKSSICLLCQQSMCKIPVPIASVPIALAGLLRDE